jgi:hypothetical protein
MASPNVRPAGRTALLREVVKTATEAAVKRRRTGEMGAPRCPTEDSTMKDNVSHSESTSPPWSPRGPPPGPGRRTSGESIVEDVRAGKRAAAEAAGG